MSESDGMEAAVTLQMENPAASPLGAGATVTHLTLQLRGEHLVLSDFMPILENVGLRVIAMSPADNGAYVFAVQDREHRPIDIDGRGQLLTDAILAVRAGDACNDALNALVLSAGLAWREVEVLRAYCEYAFQLKVVPSRMALPSALLSCPAAARTLVELFAVRFDPAVAADMAGRAAAAAKYRREFMRTLGSVTALADDRALRRLLTLVEATTRTNYFMHGGVTPTARSGGVPYISIKLLSELLEPLVATRLRAEVWVQSPRMAGIHLRRGKVSRGGLRHSDRPDDFRTEILGLVRTQAVKNAVIVPAGSKGGFVIRSLPTDPKEYAAEVEAQYRTLIRGLLDVTDNLVDGEVSRPAGLIVHDDPDPYLVVAADKGTAKFSDVANAVAADYAFWLDDAFASGGSNGYDHKELAITARGAWECVRRHFWEMGKDTQTDPFTVVGIGDMSGDVFGNGMLLSGCIRLIAAFDHRHIFVDPDPHPAASFAERKRLFDLGRSSWADYDAALLSQGGFIVARGVKEVELTAAVRDALGVTDDMEHVDGETLIGLILRAPVDLLWNGGIGTYVKASDETHAAAGDPANDAVRIDATELRCAVLGEGGNLGLTQRARVQFSINGGRCYTDAIDNSGGVELSDREVNLKILLNAASTAGRLDGERRNALLRACSGAVADRVLQHNRSQSRAVSLDALRARDGYEPFHAFMVALEQDRVMERIMEALPSLEVLTARRAQGHTLTRPELSVLLAYAKLTLKQQLLSPGELLDDAALQGSLVTYFPADAVEVAGMEALAGHRLRREIVATELANDLVDLMGAPFVHRMGSETGSTPVDVARAWFIAAELCGARELSRRLLAPQTALQASVVYRWLLGLSRVLERTTHWVLVNIPTDAAVSDVIAEYVRGLRSVRGNFGDVVTGPDRELFDARVGEMRELAGSGDLAASLITLRFLDQLLEILTIARGSGAPAVRVGRAYYLTSELLSMTQLRQALETAASGSRWDQRAAALLTDELSRAHRRLVANVLDAGAADEPVEALFARTTAALDHELAAFHNLVTDIAADGGPTLPSLMIVVRELSTLTA
jgi:glutamate dehydrogenase